MLKLIRPEFKGAPNLLLQLEIMEIQIEIYFSNWETEDLIDMVKNLRINPKTIFEAAPERDAYIQNILLDEFY